MSKIKKIFIEGAISSQFVVDSIEKHTVKTNIGGHSIFLGQIRADSKNGKEVESIEFTAYQEMAEKKLAEIREDIFSKYNLVCMHVYHSLGIVKKGEICLFVFTSSGHREPAIQACNEMVERLKKELPIWGKEIYDDHTHHWKENR